VALAAQGFADPPLGREPDVRAVRTRVLDRLGLIQIDSVNVLARAHYLPVFSRLGPYDTTVLDRLSHRPPRRLFEYWGHEASLIRVDLQPALRWRMARARDEAWRGMRHVARRRPELLTALLDEVRERGPLSAGELVHHDEPQAPKGPWWDWSDVKRGLEFLFWSGELTSARRRGFERMYDLPERVFPAEVLATATPADDEAHRILLRVAARALGVATETDLRDYFRLGVAEARAGVAELVEAGELTPVIVEGWKPTGFLAAGARVPRSVDARALLCPFDPLIWERPRVQRLFGMQYRIEIYVPREKRVHGYYVFPLLLGDQLVGRADLKADRATRRLLVQAAHTEPGAPPETADALAAQLRSMAQWLALDDVTVVGPGDLAPALRAALITMVCA
jgi:uncharacterized protein YcaQ